MLLVVAATSRELSFVEGAATLECGIGPVEAAASTARTLAELRPSALINIGLAGARGIEPPTIVIGAESIYSDLRAAIPVQVLVKPDADLLAMARKALPNALVAPIGTSARVGGTTAVAVEAMEGFGVLRAAELARVPAIEIRVVSNDVDEPDRSKWRFDDALTALAAALPPLIEAMKSR